MGYTVEENRLQDRKREVAERARQELGAGATFVTEVSPDDEKTPDFIREYAREVLDVSEQAAANPPVHEEYHVKDLVEISIPYHFLLKLIYSLQTTANDIAYQVRAVVSSTKALPEGMEMPELFVSLLEGLTARYLDFIHLGAQINSIRIAAKPLDLPDPHGEKQEQPTVSLSDKDMENFMRLLGGETFESDN